MIKCSVQTGGEIFFSNFKCSSGIILHLISRFFSVTSPIIKIISFKICQKQTKNN